MGKLKSFFAPITFFIGFFLLCLSGALVAQEWINREPYAFEKQNVAGMRNKMGLELTRMYDVFWFQAGVIIISNAPTDLTGVVICNTNAGNTQVIDFPNVTNNVGRMITVITPTNAVVVLSNAAFSGGFISSTNPGGVVATLSLTSNKIARVFPNLGTNWYVEIVK